MSYFNVRSKADIDQLICCTGDAEPKNKSEKSKKKIKNVSSELTINRPESPYSQSWRRKRGERDLWKSKVFSLCCHRNLFLPRELCLRAIYCRCVSVRLSVTNWYCMKTTERKIRQTPLHDRDSSFLTPMILTKFHRSHPQGAPNAGGKENSATFRQITRCKPYLEIGTR